MKSMENCMRYVVLNRLAGLTFRWNCVFLHSYILYFMQLYIIVYDIA